MLVGFSYLNIKNGSIDTILRHPVMKLWANPRCRNKANEGRMYLIDKKALHFFFNAIVSFKILLNKIGI